MNFIEKIIYSCSFLLNKYLGFNCIEKVLNWYEGIMINKYLSREEIDPTRIPTINAEDFTNNDFVKLSNNYRIPVLIKGYMKDTKAVSEWDTEYLQTIIGDFNINVLNKDTKISIENYTFNKFIDDMKTKNIYINNNHTILSNFPILFDDIKTQFNNFINTLTSTNLRNIHIANLFIGYNKKDNINGSNMHCGGSGNFFCMIKGKKHWTLIDPKYSCLLKGRVAESGIHAQTLFDMPDTDLSSYPKILKHFPRYDITLEPGDILWNAPWWWHRIENINEEGLNIGLAIRNNKVTKLNLQNNFTYTLSGYTYLFYNTLLIGLYERVMLNREKHFNTKGEKDKSNVLYQIERLIKKYPKTVLLEEIIDTHLKDK
tara:strand:- start:6291 stop:7406 length:1116 start_codon:yes stop_codon:yes gene_type:complete